MLAIRLPKDIEDRLADLAAKTGRTKTYYAREAILEYLDDLEDAYLVLNRIENPGRRITMEEVEKELGLGD
jgi:RHH-type rel operon transcriptional repressor/antitoxin RelB